jgi:hypothetical protein
MLTLVILFFIMTPIEAFAAPAKADLTYVSPPASDSAGQVTSPVEYPRDLYPEIEPL